MKCNIKFVTAAAGCLTALAASAVIEGVSPVLGGDMLKVMSDMGHGEEIVISDANFPAHAACATMIRNSMGPVPSGCLANLKNRRT